MQATRQAILDYLRVHREGTVRELSREFGLTTTGIRQHLVILEGEGLVVYRDVKGRVGRPALAYRLTEEAEARYPKGYERLLVAILEAARETCSGELQARLVKAAAQRLAEPVPDAGHGTVGERAGAVATFLRSRGNVAAGHRGGEGRAGGVRDGPGVAGAGDRLRGTPGGVGADGRGPLRVPPVEARTELAGG